MRRSTFGDHRGDSVLAVQNADRMWGPGIGMPAYSSRGSSGQISERRNPTGINDRSAKRTTIRAF